MCGVYSRSVTSQRYTYYNDGQVAPLLQQGGTNASCDTKVDSKSLEGDKSAFGRTCGTLAMCLHSQQCIVTTRTIIQQRSPFKHLLLLIAFYINCFSSCGTTLCLITIDFCFVIYMKLHVKNQNHLLNIYEPAA